VLAFTQTLDIGLKASYKVILNVPKEKEGGYSRMYIYLIMYILLLVLALKEIEVIKGSFTQKQINILFLIFIMVFSIFAGIRYGIGTDYYIYLDIFNGIRHLSDYSYLEPGFRFIIWILKSIGFNSYSLFFVFALIPLAFIFKGIRDNSKFPILSVFIFMVVFNIGYVFNGIRQGIAMAIFVYLLKDIERRNFKKVLLFTIIGFSIHYSAILILFSYFFYQINISRKVYIRMTVVLFILMITHTYWSNLIVIISPKFIESKITYYISTFNSGVTIVGILQRILLLLPLLWFFPSLKNSERSFEGKFKLYYLGFIFYAIFSFQGMLATRLNMFFRILEIIILPYFFLLDNKKYEKYIIITIIILWATSLFVNDLRSPTNYPFRTIFSSK
jgi:EpsG family